MLVEPELVVDSDATSDGERLAKAVLATKSILLFLNLKGTEESLVHFAGAQEMTRVRTVSAARRSRAPARWAFCRREMRNCSS
ncbi:hypothetical protein ACIOC1_20365 [Streptomyces sp. NPDC088197]|uniref:hypothetical protein n=1 Tax=Streptomyces sp. NPDC088197 TaxID=3365840 RepID=UPI00380780B4